MPSSDESRSDEFNSEEDPVSQQASVPENDGSACENRPSADVPITMTVNWQAAFSADGEPWHTLKVPQAAANAQSGGGFATNTSAKERNSKMILESATDPDKDRR